MVSGNSRCFEVCYYLEEIGKRERLEKLDYDVKRQYCSITSSEIVGILPNSKSAGTRIVVAIVQ